MKELDKILNYSEEDKRGYTFWRLGLKESCEIIGYEPPTVILPIIRRVMPLIIANDIIGVAPMVGPVGQIFTLRERYGKDSDA